MTITDKYQKLVVLLHARSLERKLNWQFDETRGVWAQIGSRYVQLSGSRNENDEPVEIVTILNSDWHVIETFNDEIFDRLQAPGVGQYMNFYQLMAALRSFATRTATGADDAIDELLDELNDDPPF